MRILGAIQRNTRAQRESETESQASYSKPPYGVHLRPPLRWSTRSLPSSGNTNPELLTEWGNGKVDAAFLISQECLFFEIRKARNDWRLCL